jgi:site-specific recombinase XerD
MHISDIDFDRMQIHIRMGKGQKDRYVPLAHLMVRGLKQYIEADQPYLYLFNGKQFDQPYHTRSIQSVMRDAVKKAEITKIDVSPHTLRHSYATHLLEDGINIVQIQQLLGHTNIETTMRYVHLIQPAMKVVHSPIDKLYVPQA